MDVKEAYRILADSCGIEVGDTVEILRKWNYHELEERGGSSANSEKLVGKIGEVLEITNPNKSFKMEIDSEDEYIPWFVLKLVKKAEKSPLKVGDTVEIVGGSITGRREDIGKIMKVINVMDEDIWVEKGVYKKDSLRLIKDSELIEVKIGDCRTFKVSRTTASALIKQLEE